MNTPGRRLALPEHQQVTWPLRLLDALVVLVSHGLACLASDSQALEDAHVLTASVIAVLFFNLAADANGLYRSAVVGPARAEVGRAWLSWLIVPPLLLFVAFATKTTELYSRVVTLIWFVTSPILLTLLRVTMRYVRGRLVQSGSAARSVYIAGATRIAASLAARIAEEPQLGLHVDGFYDDREIDRRVSMPESLGPCAGGLNKLVEKAKAGEVDIVYVALPLRAESRIAELVRELADTTASVYVVADFMVFDLLHAQWSSVTGIPVVSVFESPFYGVNGWVKRAEDVVLASFITLLIAIPMLVISIAVKLSSPGPVFFQQRRYGLNGEEIHVLKFRSMLVMEDGASVKQATKGDRRITRVGAFLRRTSLDELPQFLNVLAGSMSIVGPRPHAVAHNEMYRGLIHGYMLRHKVKPGITGWAQVNGWRGETDTLEKMEQRVIHDLHYIQNWGILFDLRIIFRTVFGSGTRQNAY